MTAGPDPTMATNAFPRDDLVVLPDNSTALEFQVVDWHMPESSKGKIERELRRVNKRLDFDGDGDGDDGAEELPEYEILMHGATRSGHTICARVTGFCPYFFVKIPAPIVARHKTIPALKTWTERFKADLMHKPFLNRRTGRKRCAVPRMFHEHLVRVQLVQRKDFWGFTNGTKYYYLKVVCRSQALFSLLRSYFANPPDEFIDEHYGARYTALVKAKAAANPSAPVLSKIAFYHSLAHAERFRLYESNIDPFLRFIHERNLAPCGWVRIEAGNYAVVANGAEDDAYCRAGATVEVDYRYVSPIDVKSIAPLLVMSFDLECSSSHGDFPVAQKDYQKLMQDLVLAAVHTPEAQLTEATVIEWVQAAFHGGREADPIIHRVYPKEKPSEAALNASIEIIAPRLQQLLLEAKHAAPRADQNKTGETGDDEGDSDGENDKPVAPRAKSTAADRARIELAICDLLAWKTANVVAPVSASNTGYNNAPAPKPRKPRLPPLEGDPIIQVGVTCHRYGSDEIIYKHILSFKSCDPIPGAVVASYKTEAEVLLSFKELLKQLDPDILIGYNIFGFDMAYLWTRAEECGLFPDYARGWGRLSERITWCVEQKLSSSALGDNVLNTIDLDGCVSIDMLKVMQRDHKLDSFKLDTVAEIFLGDRKNDLSPNDIFAKFAGTSADRAEIARYCLQDCALVNRLLHKLKVLENNMGMGNVCSVPLSYLFMRGQGVKIFSLIAKECREKDHVVPVLKSFREDVEEIEDEEGYEGAIVLPPKEGMYLEDAITVFDYASLYPSSMIERDLSHDRFVDEDCEAEFGNLPGVTYKTIVYDVYEGKGDAKHVVGQKRCKFAQAPGGEKGILPTILNKLLTQRKNTRKKMEYETLTLTLEGGDKTISGIVKTVDADTLEVFDVETGARTNVPLADVTKRAETYSIFEKAMLDAMQLAYKVTANSLYGQMGARTSPVFWKDIAACTTATGRERIIQAKEYMEENYKADVIYGDTDSIFCKIPHYDSAGNKLRGRATLAPSIKAGQEASVAFKPHLPKPQSLEYEKTFFPFILFSKKRYAGNLYEDDANKKPKLKTMGIVLKRRDNAPIVKTVYGGILDTLLNRQDLPASVAFLRQSLTDLIEGRCPLEDLIISKTLRGHYKDPERIAHKVLADRMGARDPGNKPQTNDRIPYVYIQTNGQVALQGDRIENPDYIRAQSLRPDTTFYITNQIMKPLCQLFALCVEQLPDYPFPPSYWEERDEELLLKPLYQNPRKRKDRLMDLKMRCVEDLLFSPFLPAKAVRALKAAKPVAQLSELVGDAGTPGKDAFTFHLTCVETDIPKEQKTKGKKADANAPIPMMRAYRTDMRLVTVAEETIEWERTICAAKSRVKSKTMACIQAMAAAMHEWPEELMEKVRLQGIKLSLEKAFANTLKKSVDDSMRERLERATAEADMEAMTQCRDELLTLAIWMVLKDVPHMFV